MRAFIVRPFGVKEGIDFDRVERELIQPALGRLGELGVVVEGGTTGEITRAGNIREDMFRLLVVSDVVIADVSIHNANAFYELGVRHALRPRHTLMIRSETEHKYPFDLQTDRYFLYDAADPAGKDGATVDALARALRSTLAAPGPSSPIFQLLPGLQPHRRAQLVKVPQAFAADVDRARRDRQRGDLRLLAYEAQGLEWDQEGLSLVGEAQFRLRAHEGARETFEALVAAGADDSRVYQRLGTIYQRLAFAQPADRREPLLARSDQAIGLALEAAQTAADRAEVTSLLASNAKSRWMDELRAAPPDRRRATALRSAHFARMLELYLAAVNADLNAHYPGVNALAMLQAQTSLAHDLPDVWAQEFDDEQTAAASLAARERLATRLVGVLTLALQMDEVARTRGGPEDPWSASSRADLQLLTLKNRPERVAQVYRQVVAEADWFSLDAMRRNLGVFQELQLFEPNTSAALDVVDSAAAVIGQPPARLDQAILFAGHMVDAANRPTDRARFPRSPAAEATARRLIEEALRAELEPGGIVLGIAGGACGGDILFHEVCRDLGVPTQLLLALPEAQFQVESVQRGGPAWVERYRNLCERVPPRILQESKALPAWVVDTPGYDLWQRNNLWMLFNALATGARRPVLIALHNPEREADGPGGTRHLLQQARRWGFKCIEIDARPLVDSEARSAGAP